MSLKLDINNFIKTYQDQRNINYDIYKQNYINDIDKIGNILNGNVVSLFNNKEIHYNSTTNKCECDKIGYDECNNTSSFKTDNRLNLCWKHSYLYSQLLS